MTAPRLDESPHTLERLQHGRRTRARGAVNLALFMVLAAGGCDLPVGTEAPAAPQPRSEKLGTVKLHFDRATGTVTGTLEAPGGSGAANSADDPVVVNAYLDVVAKNCTRCDDGVWQEIHDVGVVLEAKSLTRIYNLAMDKPRCTLNCTVVNVGATEAPNPVVSGNWVAVVINVEPLGPGDFTVRFNLWGEPVAVA